MKKAVIVLLVLLGSLLSGCGTLVEPNYPDRLRRQKLQLNLQQMMMNEDIDALLLLERNTHLTQWHPYVGY